MSLHFHRKGKNTCLCFPIAVSRLLLPLKLLKYAFQTYCLNCYWNYSLLVWAATSPIHYGMGIQFVRIFFVPVLSSKNLLSFPSFPFFLYLAGAKGSTRLQCHTSFCVGAYQLIALLGFGIAAPVLFIPAVTHPQITQPAQSLAIPQF